jgi:hypothetical protein
MSSDSSLLPDLNVAIKAGLPFGRIEFSDLIAKTPTANTVNEGIAR